MIFSAKKWNNGKELKAVMKVNTAISFDMMEAPLPECFPAIPRTVIGRCDGGRSGRDI